MLEILAIVVDNIIMELIMEIIMEIINVIKKVVEVLITIPMVIMDFKNYDDKNLIFSYSSYMGFISKSL